MWRVGFVSGGFLFAFEPVLFAVFCDFLQYWGKVNIAYVSILNPITPPINSVYKFFRTDETPDIFHRYRVVFRFRGVFLWVKGIS